MSDPTELQVLLTTERTLRDLAQGEATRLLCSPLNPSKIKKLDVGVARVIQDTVLPVLQNEVKMLVDDWPTRFRIIQDGENVAIVDDEGNLMTEVVHADQAGKLVEWLADYYRSDV